MSLARPARGDRRSGPASTRRQRWDSDTGTATKVQYRRQIDAGRIATGERLCDRETSRQHKFFVIRSRPKWFFYATLSMSITRTPF